MRHHRNQYISPFVGIFLLFFILCPPVGANEGALYVISGVEVDVTSDSAVVAREQALKAAQAKAFGILAQRLLSAGEEVSSVVPDPDVVASMIRNFEIETEKSSDVRYIARLTFTFEPDLVQQYFSEGGVSFSDVQRKAVLILPFYQSGEVTRIWEDPNPWRDTWSVANVQEGLVPIVVPLGDLADVNNVPDMATLSDPNHRLDPIVQRYNADGVLIAVARETLTGLQVDLYQDRVGAFPESIKVEKTEGQDVYKQAARAVQNHVQQDWKDRIAAGPVVKNELTALVRFSDMRDWVSIQSELRDIALISEYSVISLTPSGARVNIHFNGDENRLRLALAQKDLRLSAPVVAFDPSVLGQRTQSPVLTYNLDRVIQ